MHTLLKNIEMECNHSSIFRLVLCWQKYLHSFWEFGGIVMGDPSNSRQCPFLYMKKKKLRGF
jgi:hypothetical protein